MEITVSMAVLMTAASTLAGIAGTWAVLRYKVDRAAASAAAAHRRLDVLEPTVTRHQVLHEQHERRLTEALDRVSETVEHFRKDVEHWVENLDKKLDAVMERELERGRGGTR